MDCGDFMEVNARGSVVERARIVEFVKIWISLTWAPLTFFIPVTWEWHLKDSFWEKANL